MHTNSLELLFLYKKYIVHLYPFVFSHFDAFVYIWNVVFKDFYRVQRSAVRPVTPAI